MLCPAGRRPQPISALARVVPGLSPGLLKTDCKVPTHEIDWIKRWGQLVAEREAAASEHADTGYWDRRAASYARSTQARVADFIQVLEPYVSASRTLID